MAPVLDSEGCHKIEGIETALGEGMARVAE